MKKNKNIEEIINEYSKMKARKERVNLGMCATCGSKENHDEVGEFGTFTHQWDGGVDAIVWNEIDFLRQSLTQHEEEVRRAERERLDRIVRTTMDNFEVQTNEEFIACDELAIRIIKTLNNK